ncbi:MAG: hypothetical protein DCC55_23185 [Chloroflexi bacterium]|nr:MAG: hypothetical protein DCC55_23185 [Chloroflexota bacterium]
MHSVYRLRANELDERFIRALQLLFEDKIIEITVSEVSHQVENGTSNGIEHGLDETDYLLRSPANRKHLLEAVAYINRGQPLIEVDLDTLYTDTATKAADDDE